jgi:hypothetical protein
MYCHLSHCFLRASVVLGCALSVLLHLHGFVFFLFSKYAIVLEVV